MRRKVPVRALGGLPHAAQRRIVGPWKAPHQENPGPELVRLTDTGLDLIDHRIADLWRGARDRAEASEAAQLRRYRRLVAELARLAEDEQLDATELKRQLRSLIAVVTPERMPTRMAATRQELARSGKDLGLLLAMAQAMDLQ